MTGLPRKSEAANIPSMVDGRFLLKTIKHTLKGGLLLRKGHIPQAGHVVPENFLGVGVAASDDARTSKRAMLVPSIGALIPIPTP